MSNNLGKRGRGLDPAVMAWLMTTLQVGPGIGDVHFVVKVDAAYYSWLRDDLKVHASKIHHSVAAGEDALVASRNDCLLVYPGAYDEVAELAWDKANTHLVGLGGPNVGGDWAEPNVVIYSDTATIASVITVTGGNCQFHNAVVSNYGTDTTALTAFTLDNYGAYFKNMGFQGCMTAGSDGEVEASSLSIKGAAFNPVFENCIIGQDNWDTRTATGSGVLNFSDTGGRPSGGWFKGCRFLSTSVTAGVAMVRINRSAAIGRSWLFDGCEFSNWNEAGTKLTQVFHQGGAAQKTAIRLKNCAAYGYSYWTVPGYGSIMSVQPVSTVGGGLEIEPVATVS